LQGHRMLLARAAAAVAHIMANGLDRIPPIAAVERIAP
jgi:hypothetical protein